MLAVPAVSASATSAASGATLTTAYKFTTLSNLGAPFDLANAAGVNDLGWVVGDANTPDSTSVANAHEHPTLWRNGVITDLGTLGGPKTNGSIGFVARPSDTGLITGNAQNDKVDPLNEGWSQLLSCDLAVDPCARAQLELRPFAWQDGVMRRLPTLGGNNGLGIGVANDEGQMVGFAETATQDSNCVGSQRLDFEPVVWGPQKGQIKELPTYQHDGVHDAVGGAVAINDLGQIVGGSGYCAFPNFPDIEHALLWQPGGSLINLGSLGGTFNNVADAINNQGQVAGFSDLPGDATTHAFLWEHGAMTDLGTLPGDVNSFAYGINDAGQVVGQSCDANGSCRAVLWQDGMVIDLNTAAHIPATDTLGDAEGINSWGEIVGADAHNGTQLGFTLVPCEHDPATASACSSAQNTSRVDRANIPQPEMVRSQPPSLLGMALSRR
jgi:probable HAF family extracellular repeat protein